MTLEELNAVDMLNDISNIQIYAAEEITKFVNFIKEDLWQEKKK